MGGAGVSMQLKIKKVDISLKQRLICIGDIHGEVDLLKELLNYVRFDDDDILVLLGDYYARGSKPIETLEFVMELSKKSNVHTLRGNSDSGVEGKSDDEGRRWVDTLPHIIESEHFIFVHAGLTSTDLEKQNPTTCMVDPGFYEKYDGEPFSKWVIVGHWPVDNYCYEIPNYSPIISNKKRIVSIDGGMSLRSGGQLNAFMIQSGKPTWRYVDKLGAVQIKKKVEGKQGTLNINYTTRFIEMIEAGKEFSLVRHIATGQEIEVPSEKIYKEGEKLCITDQATNHNLSLKPGHIVKIVQEYTDRFYGKIDGEAGWVFAGALGND